jgi:hypothetical protein
MAESVKFCEAPKFSDCANSFCFAKRIEYPDRQLDYFPSPQFRTARRRDHSAERHAEAQMASNPQNLTAGQEERAAEDPSKAMKRKAKSSIIVKRLRPGRREQLLAQAKITRSFEPVAQRNTVNKLILESVWSRACTSVEILEAAYGDPKGHRYWELWLFEPLPIYQFAELLALDLAATNGVPVLDRYLSQIFERLRAAAEAGETWLIGDTSPLITETWSSLSLRNSAVAVRPREAIAWMHRNPNARHLVPKVLAGMAESPAERTNVPGAEGGVVSLDTLSQVRTSTVGRTGSVARADVGKRPRIKVYLTEHYPNGVPSPAHTPRKILRSDLLKWDRGLAPLDEGTLKLAIEEFNAGLPDRDR